MENVVANLQRRRARADEGERPAHGGFTQRENFDIPSQASLSERSLGKSIPRGCRESSWAATNVLSHPVSNGRARPCGGSGKSRRTTATSEAGSRRTDEDTWASDGGERNKWIEFRTSQTRGETCSASKSMVTYVSTADFVFFFFLFLFFLFLFFYSILQLAHTKCGWDKTDRSLAAICTLGEGSRKNGRVSE